MNALLDRISRIERELADLQRSVYAGAPAPAAGSASTAAAVGDAGGMPQVVLKLQQIEGQLRSLTGKVEELGFRSRQLSDRMDRLQSDTDIRLRNLEGNPAAPASTGGASGSSTPPRSSEPQVLGQLNQSDLVAGQVASSAPAIPDGTPAQQYQAAFDLLVQHDFDRAESAFTAFLQNHPDDSLAGNAKYWLGETYYVRERYEQAAVAFLEGYQQFPASPKAADNLLKLGMSLARTDRSADACATFAKLQQDFPDAPTNVKRRVFLESQRLQCGG